ncbi:DNA cytosine methyltransferase [Streptomyces purpureus]|nr:DNA cytosine methyltransferase [Streptomyces purpureus]
MNAVPPTGPITVVDLFAGCGGFTRGFHSFRPTGEDEAGPVFNSVAAVEHNEAAAATYSANFTRSKAERERIHCGDIQKWKPKGEALEAEVVLGGPPCQGFSGLGLQDPDDPRNKLWREYVRAVSAIEPKVFVIENVDRFLRSDEFFDLHKEVEEGSLKKYRLIAPPGSKESDSWHDRRKRFLLNSANYGAPQARRRAIVIGVREDLIDESVDPLSLGELWYPGQTHSKHAEAAVEAEGGLFGPEEMSGPGRRRWEAVRSIFELSRTVPMSSDLPYRTSRTTPEGDVLPPTYWTYELHMRRKPELLSLARYQAIPPGGNRKDLRNKKFKVDAQGDIVISTDAENYAKARGKGKDLSTPSWDRHDNGTGDVMGRLRIDDPSVTIRTEFFKPEKGRYLHPTEHRPITHYEAALIQGFPLDFKWCGSRLEIARQIGNAVPIPLGRAIAAALHRQLRPPRG